jgi:MYXO-CTERM domain-containing protein
MRHTIGSRVILAALVAAVPLTASAAPGDPGSSEPPVKVADEVVGGQPVPDGKWPDAAAVLYNGTDPTRNQGCTGVLIAPDVVLTAGHCIDESISAVFVNANDLRSNTGQVLPVQRAISYSQWWRSYDIGVLLLAQPSTVTPRPIASGCIGDQYAKNGAQVAIVGYGATDSQAREYGFELREAYTAIHDVDCTSTPGCESNVSPGGELLAGGDGIDSCNGDSGGPLYLLTDRGEYLIGITSRATGDATVPCSDGGIYVRADAVFDWVRQETGRTIEDPTCNFAPEPSAQAIEVEAGDTASTSVAANDPDVGDTHTYSIAVGAEHGELTLHDDGTVEYHARDDYEGPDTFTIAVTDNGAPNLTGQVQVNVTVLPTEGCGCRSSRPGAGPILLFLLVGLALTRRRAVR